MYQTADSAEVILPVNTKSLAEKTVRLLNENLTLGKSRVSNPSGVPGEIVSYSAYLQTGNLSLARAVGTPTFVDLLPLGVTPKDPHPISGLYPSSTQLIESAEVVYNFNNTGRAAVIIKFKAGIIDELRGGDANVPYSLNMGISGIINDEIIPSQAETPELNNNNEVFFFFAGQDDDLFAKMGVHTDGDGRIESNQTVQDIYDVDQDGSTDDFVLKAWTTTLGSGVEEVRGKKLIRSTEPEDDAATGTEEEKFFGRPWVTTGVATRYSDGSAAWGSFEYNLQVRNFTDRVVDNLSVYDVIPYKGDATGSAFNNRLQGPLRIFRDGADVSNEYIIYYYLGQQGDPPASLSGGDTLLWTEGKDMAAGDYAKTRAVKVVLIAPNKVNEFKIINIYMDMLAPVYDKKVYISGENKAINTFEISYDNLQTWGTTNSVYNTLLVSVPVTKQYVDGNPNMREPITVSLYQNGVLFKNYRYLDGTMVLDEEDAVDVDDVILWRDTFIDLPVTAVVNGKVVKAVYTIDEENVPQGFKKTVTANPDGSWLITNQYVPETMVLEATKEWVGGPAANKTNVPLQLYRYVDDNDPTTEPVLELVPETESKPIKSDTAPFTTTWTVPVTSMQAETYTYLVKEKAVVDNARTVNGSS